MNATNKPDTNSLGYRVWHDNAIVIPVSIANFVEAKIWLKDKNPEAEYGMISYKLKRKGRQRQGMFYFLPTERSLAMLFKLTFG